MAATTLRELLVSIGLDADNDAIDKFDAGIEEVKGHLGDLATAAAGAFAVLAAGAATMIAQASATGAYAEQVREQAAALGITTDAYQELSFAAGRYGIDSEKITVILSKLAVDQKAIADGNADVTATYAALGLSVEEVAKAKPEQLFAMMADGFGTVTDASTRLAIASTLFGDRIASSLLPMLAGGSAGLADMAAQAHALGVVLSADAIKRADAFNDQLEVMGAVVSGLRNELGMALIPMLSRLASELLVWIASNRELISTKIDVFAKRVGDAFDAGAAAVKAANKVVGGLDGWIRLLAVLTTLGGAMGAGWVAAKIVLLVSALVEATVAAAAFVGGFAALGTVLAALLAGLASIAIVVAQWAAFLLVIEDVYTWLSGGDSVVGRFVARWSEADGILGAVARTIQSLGSLFLALLPTMTVALDGFLAAWDPWIAILQWVIQLIGDDLTAKLNVVAGILDRVAAGINAVTGAIGGGAAPGAAAGAPTGLANPTPTGAAMQQAASYAPSSTTRGAASSSSMSVGGDTVQISGVGLSAEQVDALVKSILDAKARRTADTFSAAEV